MTTEQQQEFRDLIEKHKADDQPKVFQFAGKYYRLRRDEFNVMNWIVSAPMSPERYQSEITGVPLNVITISDTSST